MPFGKKKEPKEPKAPKEKKPKKPKKAKTPKPKKEKAPKGKKEKDPNKKKSPIKLLIPVVLIAAAAAVAFFFLRPKGEQEEEPKLPELPAEYAVGDLTITGMAVSEEENEVQAIKAKTVVYTYTGLKDAGSAAKGYTSQLTAETPKFSVVDEEFVRTDQPDFTVPEGTVLLARDIEAGESGQPAGGDAQPAEDGSQEEEAAEPVSMVLTVRIDWSEGVCVVTADEAEGTVTSPPPPPVSGSGSSGGVTMYDVQQQLKEMNPAKLGLSGASMDEYEVLPMDGVVMVDGQPCIRANIYSDNNVQQSNEFMGSYLMSIDGLHLYQLNPATGEVKEIEEQD